MRKKYAIPLLWRQGLWMTAVSLTLRWLGIRFGTMLARHAGADVVGLSSLAGGAVGFAMTLSTAGVGLGCTQLVSEGLGRQDETAVRRAFTASVRYALLIGLLTAGALYLCAEPLAVGLLKDGRTAAYLRLQALTLPAVALGCSLSGYLSSLRRAPLGAAIRTFGEFARVGLLLFLFGREGALTPGDATEPLLLLSLCNLLTEWGVFLATLFALLLLTPRGAHRGVISLRLLPNEAQRRTTRRYLQTVLPLTVSACFRSALLYAEHLLIPDTLIRHGLSRTEALGDFGILHGMVFPLILLPSAAVASFGGLLIPEVAEDCARRTDEANKRIRALATRALSLTLLFSVGIGVCFFVFSGAIAHTLFPGTDTAAQIRFLALLIPVMYTDMMTDVFLKGFGEHVYSMKVNILDALLSLLLVAVTVPRFGMYGYLAGVWFTESFNLLMSYLRLRRHLHLRLRPLLPVAFSAAWMFILAGLARRLLPVPTETPALILCLSLPLLFYALSLWCLYRLKERHPLFRQKKSPA